VSGGVVQASAAPPPREVTPERVVPTVCFDDVAGQDRAVSDVRDWIELPLKHPELFQHVGVPTQVGVILYGPPGTGKTLLAQAVAGECQAHLEMISGPEILSKWVGQSEETLRTIFDRARKMAPSIVLLDEIDAIAPTRDGAHNRYEITLVSQLLSIMNGLYDRGQVVVIATTNRLDAVDAALRRPGRFDYAVEMGLPDVEGRRAIFDRHIRRMAAKDVDTGWFAKLTPGASGADIAKICRQAGLHCVKEAINEGFADVESVTVESRHFLASLGELSGSGVNAVAGLAS
jgi:transitional endoplasmic reticulum ATPase